MYNKRVDSFEWDERKNVANQSKHGLSFEEAQVAFLDKKRLILIDKTHSTPMEKRFYCVGKIAGGTVTVRFTYRNNRIRIIGAGYWRKGRELYEKEN